MKRILGIVGAVVVLAWTASAWAQALPGQIMNTIFFQPGCASYVASIGFPPAGALCIDTISGGVYVSNGTAFVVGGTEILNSNGGAGQITATTAFFSAGGNTTNATTEVITMELPLGPQAVTVRNLACWDSVAPGAGNTDAFTVRTGGPGFVAVGSMTNSVVTCSISGATATSCASGTTLSAPLASGSVLDIKDTTTGTPAARTIGCTVQVDM